MDVQVVRRPRHATGHVQAVGDLIGGLGGSGFSAMLFSEVRKLCGCAHFVALTSSEPDPIKVILAANEGPGPLARETAQKYIAHHWRDDPINVLLPKLGAADVTVRTTPRDIGSERYRKDCYSLPKLTERFTLLRRRDGVTSRLHLYRAKDTGSFSDREIQALTGVSEVLFALIAKHNEMARGGDGDVSTDLRRPVLLMMPDMPRREVEVCIGIARGQTSEAIALSLGISPNTVLTYRKRAYARLRITSANELLARIYAASSTPS